MKNQTSILIVDDDKAIRKLISIYLKNEAYDVYQASNGVEALELINQHSIDCIVLDVMMPELDGLQTLMKIREEKVIPVILLSAKSEDLDKITGLSLGADDYMTKPFNPLELAARIKAQVRRYKVFHEVKESSITVCDMTIDTETRQVTVNSKQINFTPREFDILLLMSKDPERVFSTEQIYSIVWKTDPYGSDNTVMVHIRKIREKLEQETGKRYIETVWGVGYKIKC
ncbi:response regulator transcription factor [Sutcliffiella horikoshii]|uniref:response regulator transcription factor n=1 Tax=Sutcliffiella horikoshii TaxID=79883 RepID=UPI00203E9117|nr:response regulator transcription factor [Sutcliffiella horikoshii]MCM3618354.1 response regulator transcription factor [Sutcliffiella horikoshii]